MENELKQFEEMKDLAELKALSRISLEKPLDNDEFNKMMDLKNKLLIGGLR